MSAQQITPQLRQWIIEQATAGHTPDAVLQAMLDSGWQEEVAVQAMEQTLEAHLRERARAQQQQPAEQPAAEAQVAKALPEPDLETSPSVVQAGDREVRVLLTMRDPRVVVFGGLLSDDECDELMSLAGGRLARSETVKTDTGTSEINAARTSEGMFFQRGENPLCARIEERIAALLRWPLDHGEGLQVLRYRPGAEYKPHYDYFDPAQPGTATVLRRGGQRVGTLVVYLNTPVKGGATTFPDVKLDVAPIKGNAVFFSYDRAHPATRTLHGGAPVIEGEKWVATKWLREGRFE
ncbi:2OG-Fe(II) oxygenase [Caldimonas brevitalea]|uniref:Proline dioxygenase n=1 Tax=Caldimonas brevitalea TaxID=413882 RepID=A0A0G3BKP3_9BURK|nr:2OG-Fe(II) oxygenase [Caldimonas brevitalea]AKJ30029.1 proline dioxygenase [Caldimonas brevitalea]